MRKHFLAGAAFLLPLTLLLSSCDKAGSNPFDFSSITIRDSNGQVIAIDETDWRNNETWTAREQKLFTKYALYTHTEGENFLITALAYPNPSTEVVQLNFQGVSSETFIELKFVDEGFKVLGSAKLQGSGTSAFNIANIAGGKKHIRVYYLFVNGNVCLGKGHGDIEID